MLEVVRRTCVGCRAERVVMEGVLNCPNCGRSYGPVAIGSSREFVVDRQAETQSVLFDDQVTMDDVLKDCGS